MAAPGSRRDDPIIAVRRWFKSERIAAIIRENAWKYMRRSRLAPTANDLEWACAVADVLYERFRALASKSAIPSRTPQSEIDSLAKLDGEGWARLVKEGTITRQQFQRLSITIKVERACRSTPPAAWLAAAIDLVRKGLAESGLLRSTKGRIKRSRARSPATKNVAQHQEPELLPARAQMLEVLNRTPLVRRPISFFQRFAGGRDQRTPDIPGDEKTIRAHLRYLHKLRLVDYPPGGRKGVKVLPLASEWLHHCTTTPPPPRNPANARLFTG